MTLLLNVASLQRKPRAVENATFVIAPCAVGVVDGDGECYGHSLTVNPWGEVLVGRGVLARVVQMVFDLDQVASAREKIPSLSHDQTDDLLQET